MTTHCSRLSFFIAALMFAAGCTHSPRAHVLTPLPPGLPADTVLTATGNAPLDSLLQLAATARQDTVLARLYYDIGLMYEDNDFEKAKAYYLKLHHLSDRLDWSEGRYLFSRGFSLLLTREGLVDSALVVNLQALELAKKEKNERWMAAINANTGVDYFAKNWYETALQHYMEALPFYEKTNDTEMLGDLYYKI